MNAHNLAYESAHNARMQQLCNYDDETLAERACALDIDPERVQWSFVLISSCQPRERCASAFWRGRWTVIPWDTWRQHRGQLWS